MFLLIAWVKQSPPLSFTKQISCQKKDNSFRYRIGVSGRVVHPFGWNITGLINVKNWLKYRLICDWF